MFSLVILPYITRVLGPTGVGRVSFADSATQYFIIFASLGIPVYGVREVARYKSDRKTLSGIFSELVIVLLISTIILAAIFFTLIALIPAFRNDKHLFYLGVVQLFFSAFLFDWFYQGLEDFKYIAIRSFLIRLLASIVVIFVVKKNSDVFLYYSILTVTVIGNAILNILYVPEFTGFSFKGLNIKRHLKPIFTFFSTRFVTSIYVILLTVVLGFVASKELGFVAGNESVAFFSSSFKIYMVILAFVVAFSSVLIPRLSEYIFNNRHKEGISLISKSLGIIFSCGIPIVVALIFFSKGVVMLLFGERFLPARADLELLSPLILVISVSNIFAMNVLTPRGKEGQFLKATIAGMLVSIVLMIVLLPSLFDKGAAITLLATECVVCAFLGYYSYPYLTGLDISLKMIVLNLLSSLVIFGLAGKFMYLIHQPIIYQFLISAGISLIVYLVVQIGLVKEPLAIKLFKRSMIFFRGKKISKGDDA
jgi:O-antigen/teichoic acid export membrane protein